MPLTKDYTYQLGDSGVLLNGDDTTINFVDIEKVQGIDSAPIRTTERDHEGTDGGFMDAEFEKGRPIVLEGTVYAINAPLSPYLDSLKSNWAPSSTPVPFYYKEPGVGERLLFIKPLGCRYDIEGDARVGRAAIQLSGFAEDPRIYNSTLEARTIYQGDTITTGRSYPRSYSYGYGVATSTEVSALIVDGNRPTPPVFSITGPVTTPQIVNETTGQSMIFDITVNAGETLVVDMGNRTVQLNGQNRRAALRSPDWFFLVPGTNYIRFRAVSTNIVPGAILNANPFFETNVANWTGVGGTLTQSFAQFHQGAASMLLTPDGVTATVQAVADNVNITVGKKYYASAWVRCAVARTITMSINWRDAGNALLSTSTGPSIALSANTWTFFEMTTPTAPVGAAFAQFFPASLGSTPLASHLTYIDEAKFQQAFPSSMSAQYRSAWR